MFRFLLLLVLLAGVAGYFTKPTEAQHRDAVNATLREIQEQAASNFDLGGLLETGIAQLTQGGAYTDFYVASRYVAEVNDRPLAECWGAFGQVRCVPKVSGDGGGASTVGDG